MIFFFDSDGVFCVYVTFPLEKRHYIHGYLGKIRTKTESATDCMDTLTDRLHVEETVNKLATDSVEEVVKMPHKLSWSHCYY